MRIRRVLVATFALTLAAAFGWTPCARQALADEKTVTTTKTVEDDDDDDAAVTIEKRKTIDADDLEDEEDLEDLEEELEAGMGLDHEDDED